MKNIHILQTDKPSRLSILNSGKLNFGAEIMSSSNSKPQHICITNDEEIKEGDWYFDGANLVHKKTKYNDALVDGNKQAKKIILTTDPSLDGVQAIDDEFLEWFVKNPSCEEFEIQKEKVILGDVGGTTYIDFNYKIIIPKEEFKQETIEEAAENYSKITLNKSGLMSDKQVNGFIAGAKWQAERMYSQEEVLEQLNILMSLPSSTLDKFTDDEEMVTMKWLEQFKKK